ncbi:hypothetical protein Nmel_017249 [Mimus melanotis]
MAAPGVSKAEYLRRYLSGPAEPAQPRRRRKKKPPGGTGRAGMRIVDDDVSWNSIAAAPEKEEEEDEGDMPVGHLLFPFGKNLLKRLSLPCVLLRSASGMGEIPARSSGRTSELPADQSSPFFMYPCVPRASTVVLCSRTAAGMRQRAWDYWEWEFCLLVSPWCSRCVQVAEFIDERPEEVKLMEEFRTNSKWKLLGDEDSQSSDISGSAKSAVRRRHDSPEPAGKHNGSSDLSPPRRQRHDTPDPSPPRRQRHDTPDLSPPKRQRHDTPDLSPPRWQCQDLSPRREKPGSPSGKKSQKKGECHTLCPPGDSLGSLGSCSAGTGSPERDPPGGISKSSLSDLSPPGRTSPTQKEQHRSRSPPGSPKKVKGVRFPSSCASPVTDKLGRFWYKWLCQGCPCGLGHSSFWLPPCQAAGAVCSATTMSSGVRAGLVSADVLQREKQELRKHERSTKHLEGGSVEHSPSPSSPSPPLLCQALALGWWWAASLWSCSCTCCWEPWPGSLFHVGVSEQCQGRHRECEMLLLCKSERADG